MSEFHLKLYLKPVFLLIKTVILAECLLELWKTVYSPRTPCYTIVKMKFIHFLRAPRQTSENVIKIEKMPFTFTQICKSLLDIISASRQAQNTAFPYKSFAVTSDNPGTYVSQLLSSENNT